MRACNPGCLAQATLLFGVGKWEEAGGGEVVWSVEETGGRREEGGPQGGVIKQNYVSRSTAVHLKY